MGNRMPQRKVLVVKTDSTVELVDRDSPKKEYDQFSKLVEGYIETVSVRVPMKSGKTYARSAYVNEEGLLKRLPVNTAASAMYGCHIVGNLVVLLHAGDEVDLLTIQHLFPRNGKEQAAR